MPYLSDSSLQDAYMSWMSTLDIEDAVAVTLTFKRKADGKPITEKAAGDAIRVFGRMLQLAACGNRFKKGKEWINFVAVKEGGHALQDKHPHYHCFVEVPKDRSTDQWIEIIREKIKKIEAFGSENCFVTPVVDGGWFEYMFKRSDKKCYADALDIISLWTRSHST